MSRRSVIVGGSAGLGRAIAEILADRGDSIFIISTDRCDLIPFCSDLRLRYGVVTGYEEVDLGAVDTLELRKKIIDVLGGVDNLFLIAGFLCTSEDYGYIPTAMIDKLLQVNLIGTIKIVNEFITDLSLNSNGNLIGIGSIAATRGRNRNVIYSVAKRGLESYFESCRYFFSNTGGAHVQFYRLGYIKTSMTFGQTTALPMIDAKLAAQEIIKKLDSHHLNKYLPKWWFPIMLILKLLPWPIFRRLNF
jgi:short-subunit dehydrogenase